MPPKPLLPPRPTDAELEILSVLWSRGASTVRDVHEIILKRRATQYTTVLKLLQVMAEKGLVKRDERERAHVYRASRPAEWTRQKLAGDLIQRAFDGSAKNLILGALSVKRASADELEEIRQLLVEFGERKPGAAGDPREQPTAPRDRASKRGAK